ncbi:hypothetical protein LCGC14_0405520 [marine sediment metagenome]|uniref:Uncharacterized protein n=1 Tax=marine sediment metagenome TaxID=412755 RepID=A0A0F9W4M3_9ZZZZ|nr:hypothetical protein [archaeon]
MKYKYNKNEINNLYSQINPKTDKAYTSREIVEILGYGNASGMTCWLHRQKNRLVSLWLKEDEVDLINKILR